MTACATLSDTVPLGAGWPLYEMRAQKIINSSTLAGRQITFVLENCEKTSRLARAYVFTDTIAVCPTLLYDTWREHFDCAVAHELGHIAHAHWNFFRRVENELEADIYAANICGWKHMESLRRKLTTKDSQEYLEYFLSRKPP